MPASLPAPRCENCGVRRVKSTSERLIVGRRSISSVETLVPVPMLDDEMIEFDSAVTTASPNVAAVSVSAKSIFSSWLSDRSMSVRCSVVYPMNETVTV